jgi:probable rRNA maturation factor
MVNLQISETITDTPIALIRDETFFLETAQRALELVHPEGKAELSLVLTDDAQLQELNREFREVDAPTDVLSFPLNEVDPDSGNLYLGDIVISLPRAQDQAQTQGHSLEDELRLLIVHGILHLHGYDHADEQEQAAMWAVQADILNQLTRS